MPAYIFRNPLSGQIKVIIQSVNEKHIYSENGVQYERIFTSPNIGTDTKTDPFSSADFVKQTANKNEKLGDIFDRSKEASEKRKSKLGYDPVQKDYFKNWSQKRAGRRHPLDTSD